MPVVLINSQKLWLPAGSFCRDGEGAHEVPLLAEKLLTAPEGKENHFSLGVWALVDCPLWWFE